MVWYIILAIVALLTLLLVIPIIANVVYLNGDLTLNVRYGFLKFNVIPKKGKPKKAKKLKKPKKKKKRSSKKKDIMDEIKKKKTFEQKLDTAAMLYDMAKIALDSLEKPLKRLLKSFKIYDLELYLRVGGKDAYQVSKSFDMCNKIVHGVYFLLFNTFTFSAKKIYLEPNFISEESSQVADVKMKIKPIAVIAVAFGFGIRFGWKFLISKIKENKKQNV